MMAVLVGQKEGIHPSLFDACKNGDLERVQNLLESGQATVSDRDIHGRKSTPLHFAAGEIRNIYHFTLSPHITLSTLMYLLLYIIIFRVW